MTKITQWGKEVNIDTLYLDANIINVYWNTNNFNKLSFKNSVFSFKFLYLKNSITVKGTAHLPCAALLLKWLLICWNWKPVSVSVLFAIFCCFPRHITKRLNWKWYNWNSN